MTKPAAKGERPAFRIAKHDPADKEGKLRCIGGSESDKWNNLVASQVANAIWTGGVRHEQAEQDVNAVVSALVGIRPSNELEAMLGAQLVAAHAAVMECHRRASLEGETLEGRQASLNQAAKLSRAFSSLLDTFHRQRGKAQQRIVVEHVHVHAGRQALFGFVDGKVGGSALEREEQPDAKQLTDASQPTLRCPSAEQGAVQIAGDGERTLSDARRKIAGRTCRQQKRLEAWTSQR